MNDRPAALGPLNASETFWRREFQGLVIPTPLGVARQVYGPDNGSHVVHTLECGVIERLHALLAQEGLRLETALRGAWALLLHRYSGENEVLFGAALEDDGPMVPLRVRVEEDMRVREWLRARNAHETALREQEPLSFDSYRRLACLSEDQSLFGSTFEVCFTTSVPGRGDGRRRNAAGTRPRALHRDFGAVPLATVVAVVDDYAALEIRCDPSSRIDGATVRRMGGHYEELLVGLSRGGGAASVHSLTLLTDQECAQINGWNATAAPFPSNDCLHTLIGARARAAPDATAVVCHSGRSSYRDVERSANQLAHQLLLRGVGRGSVVGVCTERCHSMIVAVLAILKTGSAYLPLDPTYPETRLAFMMQDAGADLLITQRSLIEQLPTIEAPVLCLEDEAEALARAPAEPPPVDVAPTDLAYVIYTSGSTGHPKGAMLNHRGRVNNFYHLNAHYGIGPGDKLLALASLSFDMSAYDIFGTLIAGATLVLVPNTATLDPSRWAALAVRERVTVWHSVQSLLTMLLDHVEDDASCMPRWLRLVLLGGDRIPPALPDRVKRVVPGVRVASIGGATEVSMDSVFFDIEEPSSGWPSIPYGGPMPNQTVYVLDGRRRQLPVGVAGELYLGGVGVGEGYRNRPQLTEDRFVPDPFAPHAGQRMYKTGDLVRYRDDGNLELLGRLDFQIKLRGHRIELGEIEAALCRHEMVDRAVVVARHGKNDESYLAAYVVAVEGARLDAWALREHAVATLPRHMVPSAVVFLDEFPLSSNGKIDIRRFPEPSHTDVDVGDYVAPTTLVERAIAAICGEVLHVERVSVVEDLVNLGVTSLSAVRIVSRIQRAFGLDIPFPVLLEQPTVTALARAVVKATSDAGLDAERLAASAATTSGEALGQLARM